MNPQSRAKKQKRQAVILSVLALVLVGLGVRHFMPQPRKTSAAIKPPVDAAAPAAAAAKQKLMPVELTWPMVARSDPFAANGVYPPKPGPNPMTPVKKAPDPNSQPIVTAEQVQEQAQKTLKLQGMILGAVPRAVVNGRPVAAGEEVDGFRVVSIEARRIMVHKSGFDVVLELD